MMTMKEATSLAHGAKAQETAMHAAETDGGWETVRNVIIATDAAYANTAMEQVNLNTKIKQA